jgi:hypothetical protein
MPGDKEALKCFQNNDIAVRDAESWVVRGWERPHCPAIIAPAGAALVAPTHVLPEARTSTGPVLTEYQDWLQLRPKGEQP